VIMGSEEGRILMVLDTGFLGDQGEAKHPQDLQCIQEFGNSLDHPPELAKLPIVCDSGAHGWSAGRRFLIPARISAPDRSVHQHEFRGWKISEVVQPRGRVVHRPSQQISSGNQTPFLALCSSSCESQTQSQSCVVCQFCEGTFVRESVCGCDHRPFTFVKRSY
jgi:hypothetical protein